MTTARRIATRTITMHVVEAGRGRPVVFLHGLGWDNTLWAHQVARYGGDYRVIAGDTRGHGASDRPPGPYTIDLFADDWAALLDALDIKDACVVGFSQGGMIAQTLAIKRPDLMSALVLVSTSCRSHASGRENMEARITAMREQGPEASARVGAKAIFSPAYMAANPAYIETFVAWRAAMPAEPLVAAMRAVYDYDVRAGLAGVRTPCLVITGSADVLTKPDANAEVAASIPGARFETVAGAGHMIPIEQPEVFDRLIDGFLTQHYPATAPAGH
jgi:3-oxoadipate enol-lactonase